MKILLCDDSSFMRVMLKNMLVGNVFIEADNGNEMLQKYKVEKPDLVFLDITMPELDGISALKLLKKDYPDAKVIMCSAMGQQAFVIEAIKLGATDFIVKPFEASRVVEAVSKVIG